MNKIAVPKTEYRQMRRQADAYKRIVQNLHTFVLRDSVNEVVEDFKKTGLYTEGFLRDFEGGLRKSSYTKKK